jgi:hypothetical protein
MAARAECPQYSLRNSYPQEQGRTGAHWTSLCSMKIFAMMMTVEYLTLTTTTT